MFHKAANFVRSQARKVLGITAPKGRSFPRKGGISAAMLEEVEVSRVIAKGITGPMCANPRLRHVLADISTKEDAKNSHYAGLQNRLAHDRVGSGIKVRFHTENEDWNAALKLHYHRWKVACKLDRKIRTAVRGAGVRGELVGVKHTNERLRNPVKLDCKFYDPRRLTDGYNPQRKFFRDNHVDGIDLDDDWNPITYWISKPSVSSFSSGYAKGMWEASEPYPASQVIHWFQRTREEQLRGIPETTPALMLYPKLRRYTEAVIEAAEMSASIVFTLETNSAAVPPVQSADSNAFDCFDIEPGMIQQMPDGWTLRANKSEQPTTGHSEFKKSIVSEAGLCVNMPYIISAADSSGSNFSSANGDWQPYECSQKLARIEIAADVESDLLFSWYDEALLVEGLLPIGLRQRYGSMEHIPHSFGFDRLHRHADPLKGAKATEIALASGETTLEEVWQEKGGDAREGLEAEARLCGLEFTDYMRLLLAKRFAVTDDRLSDALVEQAATD